MINQYTPQVNRTAPLHSVRSWSYVRSIMRAVRRGVELPPIVVDYRIEQQLTGVHRQAANELLQALSDRQGTDAPQIPVVDWRDIPMGYARRKAVREAINNGLYDDLDDLLTARICKRALR